MATTFSLSPHFDHHLCLPFPRHHSNHTGCHPNFLPHTSITGPHTPSLAVSLIPARPSPSFPNSHHSNLILSFSASPSPPPPAPIPTLVDPLRSGRFLTNHELEKLQFLEDFEYSQDLRSGSLLVRVMRLDEMDTTVSLLAESFGESILLPVGYESLLGILVKQYLVERRTLMPHTATLVGFYKADEEDAEQLAGTVEVSFGHRGATASLPSPTPPRDCPYICNMTVRKQLRRKGIGWQLLKASEELISRLSSSTEAYLHCRVIDKAPLNMYTRAGYSIVKTDNIFILFFLQRRKHLMCKKLRTLIKFSEPDFSDSADEITA